jgi:hypothetical protein
MPSMRRHGQIASQLHDSKYAPLICQLIPACAGCTKPGTLASSEDDHIPASILARTQSSAAGSAAVFVVHAHLLERLLDPSARPGLQPLESAAMELDGHPNPPYAGR